MELEQKVVWSEGMALCPQHFQHWDRYYDQLINFRINAIVPNFWGVTELEIDSKSLENGDLVVKACEGVFPDGLAFRVTEARQLSRHIDFEKHGDKQSGGVAVYLAAPRLKDDGQNCHLDNSAANGYARFGSQRRKLNDETANPREPRPHDILVTQTNLRIFFSQDADERSGYTYIKIAEIANPGGKLALSSDYIPPCLRLGASPVLHKFVNAIRIKLDSQRGDLARKLSARSPNLVDVRTTDLATFWPLYTVNTYLPLVNYAVFGGKRKNKNGHDGDATGKEAVAEQAQQHPERVYEMLCQLAGALSTFVVDQTVGQPDVSASSLPLYDHNDLRSTFRELHKRIQLLLDFRDPDNFVEVNLAPQPDGFLMGSLSEIAGVFDGDRHFFLAVASDLPEADLKPKVERSIKIGSAPDMKALLESATPGVPVIPVDVPPDPLPVKLGYSYFELQQHPMWDNIRDFQNIAIYLPDSFPNLNVRLLIIKSKRD